MNCSAKRYRELSYLIRNTIFLGLGQCHRDSGRRGLGTKCCHISRKHCYKGLEWVFPGYGTCDAELYDKQKDMYHKNHQNNLQEETQNCHYTTLCPYFKEDAEDIEWQYRNNNLGYHHLYHLLELIENTSKCTALHLCKSKSKDKSKDKCSHH